MKPLSLHALAVGDMLPTLTLEPLNRTTLALFAGASNDHNPLHIDMDYAQRAGMPMCSHTACCPWPGWGVS
jgi:acyl dehydratase